MKNDNKKASPASQLWTSNPKNHPTHYCIYIRGLIHHKMSVTSSFQWPEAPQWFCTCSWGGWGSRLTICQLNQLFSNSEAAMLSMLSPFLKMQQCWVLNLWGDPYNTIIQTLERIHTDNYITWIDIQNDNFYRRQKIQIQIQPKYFFESCARQFLRPLSVFKWKQNYHQNQW